MRILHLIPLLCPMLSACAEVDDVGVRATQMNLSISQAENTNTLLNVVRSSLSEPISLASLTGYTGHRTRTGNIAFPTITSSKDPLTIAGSGNSATFSESNDFNYSANDDNATYAALLQPVDPATLAYFIRQEYPRELLMILMIANIKETKGGRLIANYTNDVVTAEEEDRSARQNKIRDFLNKLATLIQSGLTAQVDLTSNQLSRLCFDPTQPPTYSAKEFEHLHKAVIEPDCTQASPILGGKLRDNEKQHSKFINNFIFHNKTDGSDIEITFRSTFGIYRYLGALVANQVPIYPLSGHQSGDYSLIDIYGTDDDCFVSVDYRGKHYCVRQSSMTTKQVFALLHDLFKLYAYPSPQPTAVTLSARLVQ